MNKIFLSHSSLDKDYVSYIAEQFGKDRCVYDSLCFEAGMKNLDEIFSELEKSSIFVIFLSNYSLESDWVKKELFLAEEYLNYDARKLSQIFPIIIDPLIKHDDPRIPNFLKKGFGSYNLRVITSNVVAFRKIKAQQIKYLMENDMYSNERFDCFYGRDAEIAEFKRVFDSGAGIKCLIASGLTGIGRKSFLLQCLKQSQLIEKYYDPPTISLNNFDTIDDMIIKLAEIGFGKATLELIVSFSDMDSKINCLSEALKMVQNYKEQIVIYDNGCLINRSGDLIYWFLKSLEKIRNEVTVIIASKRNVNRYCINKNASLFAHSLSVLSRPEWMGLMRVYGSIVQVELSNEDKLYFKDILTGYPPQIKYCVDLMKDSSVEEVKKDPSPVIENFSNKITEMLESAIPDAIKDDSYGFLAFASMYGVVPNDLLGDVIEIKESYRDAFNLFKTLTICRYLGVSNEYIEINPMISDYIQRSRFVVPDDIKSILNKRLSEFNSTINTKDSKIEDFENLKYYLKSNIVEGNEIPERLMYSTIYLYSIYDLYNHRKYKQVISLVEKLKESGTFERYDVPIQLKIQGYYCRALSREVNSKFYDEVEFFKRENSGNDTYEYNFLRGFFYRHSSQYDKALAFYKRVLDKHPNHRSAMREIVIVYRGLEDFESAYEYAKINYLQEPENLYQIQSFFEILIRKFECDRTAEEKKYINEMLTTIEYARASKPNATCYEILGQYIAFEENDKERTLAILNEGIKKFPDSSYIIKTLFDCCEHFGDIIEMEKAQKKMEPLISENKGVMIAYKIRQAIMNAYQKKPKEYILNNISGINGLNEEARERLAKKINSIMNMKNNR